MVIKKEIIRLYRKEDGTMAVETNEPREHFINLLFNGDPLTMHGKRFVKRIVYDDTKKTAIAEILAGITPMCGGFKEEYNTNPAPKEAEITKEQILKVVKGLNNYDKEHLSIFGNVIKEELVPKSEFLETKITSVRKNGEIGIIFNSCYLISDTFVAKAERGPDVDKFYKEYIAQVKKIRDEQKKATALKRKSK